MSTRKGNVIKLDDMLDTAKDSMHEIMRKNEDKYAQVTDPELTADLVGKAAIMIQDMSAKRYSHIHCFLIEVSIIINFHGIECYPPKEIQESIYNTPMPDSPLSDEKQDLHPPTQSMPISLSSSNLTPLSFFGH